MNFDFSQSSTYSFDLLLESTQGLIDIIKSIYIDNSQNTNSVTLISNNTQTKIVCPAGKEGVFPVFCNLGETKFAAISGIGMTVPVIFFNVELPFNVWPQGGSGSSGLPLATGNLQFYSSITGSDLADGLSLATPVRTIQHMANIAAGYNYQGLYFPTMNSADGAYGEAVTVPLFLNIISGGYATFKGNTTTPANCTTTSFSMEEKSTPVKIDGFQINGPSNSTGCINLLGGTLTWGNIILNPGNPGYGLNCVGPASAIFDPGGGSTLTLTGGGGSSVTPFSFAGDCLVHWFSGTLAIPSAFQVANFWQVVECSSSLFIPTVTGAANVNGRSLLARFSSASSKNGLISDYPGNGLGTVDNSVLIIGINVGLFGQAAFNEVGFPGAAGQLPTHTWNMSWNVGLSGTPAIPDRPGFYYTPDQASSYYAPVGGRPVNHQTGNYTTTHIDAECRIEMDNAGANTLTVDTDANMTQYGYGLPIGTQIVVTQVGAGATTIAAAGGVTGRNFGLMPGGQWSSVMLYKRGANEWVQTNV